MSWRLLAPSVFFLAQLEHATIWHLSLPEHRGHFFPLLQKLHAEVSLQLDGLLLLGLPLGNLFCVLQHLIDDCLFLQV